MKPNRQDKYRVLLITFTCLIIISAGMLLINYTKYKIEQKELEQLSTVVSTNEISSSTKENDRAENTTIEENIVDSKDGVDPVQKILPQYASLYEENPDLFGWIRIEGTVIDYPVMFSPDNEEFYLHHSFDLSESQCGLPFLDADCSNDGFIYLLYGHHLINGSMFSAITKYADATFLKEHPTISFDTLYEEGEYQVFAAFYSRVYYSNETNVFRYYRYTDLSDSVIFDEYLEQVKTASLYDMDIEISYGDTLLVLTTCNYHTENGRFVIVAKKIG